MCTQRSERESKIGSRHKRRIQKFKGRLRSVVGRRMSLTARKKLINQRGGILIPLLSAILPKLAALISDRETMLRKMYLVSPEYLNKSKLKSTSVSPKIRNTKKQKIND